MKILTVFFSMKGETIAPGMKVVNLEKGHTNVAAEYIQQAVGGDLFEIETVKTYIADHMKMIYEAKEELEKGVRPELKAYPDNFADYDTVFIGYPNWWNTLPMPVVRNCSEIDCDSWRRMNCSGQGGGGRRAVARQPTTTRHRAIQTSQMSQDIAEQFLSFVEHFGWLGKRVIPFNTSEGSGLGKSVAWLRELCRGAVVRTASGISRPGAPRSCSPKADKHSRERQGRVPSSGPAAPCKK